MRMRMGCPGDYVQVPNVNIARVETKKALKQEKLIAQMVLVENNLME